MLLLNVYEIFPKDISPSILLNYFVWNNFHIFQQHFSILAKYSD